MKELESKGEDTSVELSGMTFASQIEFVVYYNKPVLGSPTSGGWEILSDLHVCFNDASHLLAMAFNDKDESSIKDIATLQSTVQMNNHTPVNSIIIESLCSKLLLECFGKSSASIVKSPLPEFKTFKSLDTGQEHIVETQDDYARQGHWKIVKTASQYQAPQSPS